MLLLDNALWISPWVAGLLVTLTHVPLGQKILARGIIFLDLAIAQAAALGVILGFLLHYNQPFLTHFLATLAAILMSSLLHLLEKRKTDNLEAWIGCCFVTSACFGLILLSANAAGAGEILQSILSGQLLWVTPRQLYIAIGFYIIAGIIYRVMPNPFYIIFAICITEAIQLAGVYLVFATLVMPALAVTRFKKRQGLFIGYLFSLLAYSIGLIISYYSDIPAGPLIVCCMSVQLLCIKYLEKSRGEIKWNHVEKKE
jgi:zinc/manganese transport system permease protein